MKPTHQLVAVFSGVVLLIALGVLASFWTFRQIEEISAVRKHTYSVIGSTNYFLSSLKDAETGTRGYLLTGNESFLKPYLAVRDHVRSSLKELRQRTLFPPAQEPLDTLGQLTDAKLTELAQVIELRRKDDLMGALAIERSGMGEQLMSSIRAEVQSVLQLEQGLLVQREAEFEASMRNLFTVIVTMSLLALLLALAFGYLLYREIQQRLEHLVYIETEHLLKIQEETNTKLQQANATLRDHEEELAVKNDELESANSAAKKANLAKSEFLASMSHELRTPLNAILGFAQLMESAREPPSSAQKQSIEQILKAGRHLLGLINEILDLAKIESGKTTLLREPMPLSKVLEDCQAMIYPLADQHGIQVTFPSFDKPVDVVGDPTGVKQVILNMVSNAIKYNRINGTVSVHYEMHGENRLRISVADTGSGLAPDQLEQLFQPFNRLGRESGPEEGAGIGLVVVKQLVELMGGVFGVESRVGVGSVFWFELAMSTAPKPALESVGEGRSNERGAVAAKDYLAQRTVLYVEDNPSSLALVERLIARRDDLKLLTAICGHRGVQSARANQPDLILMDLNLPDISGYDVLTILRADPTTAHIPVMVLSAKAGPRDVEKGVSAGFCRYLTKPINISEFMDALDATLSREEEMGWLH